MPSAGGNRVESARLMSVGCKSSPAQIYMPGAVAEDEAQNAVNSAEVWRAVPVSRLHKRAEKTEILRFSYVARCANRCAGVPAGEDRLKA